MLENIIINNNNSKKYMYTITNNMLLINKLLLKTDNKTKLDCLTNINRCISILLYKYSDYINFKLDDTTYNKIINKHNNLINLYNNM